MSVAELKERLISRIQSENDDAVLQEWFDILGTGPDESYELPPELLEDLDKLESEMKQGEYSSNEEVFARAKQTVENAMKK
jgi:hypothetical protein